MCVFIPELMRIALVTDKGREWWPAEVASRSAQLPQNLGGVTSSLDSRACSLMTIRSYIIISSIHLAI
jgi:hypothetical protein